MIPCSQQISHAFCTINVNGIHFLAGREQVSVGIVPIDLSVTTVKGMSGSQSALAVYPIAVANCAEKR